MKDKSNKKITYCSDCGAKLILKWEKIEGYTDGKPDTMQYWECPKSIIIFGFPIIDHDHEYIWKR